MKIGRGHISIFSNSKTKLHPKTQNIDELPQNKGDTFVSIDNSQ